MMKKLPPLEKVFEAYSAIADGRVAVDGQEARVRSSDGAKEYTVTWDGDVYASDDSTTYWQGYAGYPVLAVLLLPAFAAGVAAVWLLARGIGSVARVRALSP